MSSITGSFHEENVENLPPSTLLCTANISTQKETNSSKGKRNVYLKQRGRRKKWWYFNRSLQPISEACENKDEPSSITEPNNASTNDNNTLGDDYLNIKNQSLNTEKSNNVIVSSNDQPIFKDSYSPCLKVIEKFQEIVMDSAVRVIQAAFKRFRERRRFLRIKKAVMVIQRNLRKWIQARQCLRPAEFERQSSDGAKSDEYRESEELNKERNLENNDDDSLNQEESCVENMNGETEVNSHVSSDINSLVSIHSQHNHNRDDTTQDIITNSTASTNESRKTTISYLSNDVINQDSNELHLDANTTQQDPNPGFLDNEQKELEQITADNLKASTINNACAVCESIEETTEVGMLTESHDAWGHNSPIQLLNEGVPTDNAATIVLDPTMGHQQEYSELTLHSGKTHEGMNEKDEHVLESGKQCEHVPCGQSELNTQDTEDLTSLADNEIEKDDNSVEHITNKIQVAVDGSEEEVKVRDDSNIEMGCSQETNTNQGVEQCGAAIGNTHEGQKNTSDEQEEGKNHELKEMDKEIETSFVQESLPTNKPESAGTIFQDVSGNEKSPRQSSGTLNENNNTDNDINLSNVKV